MYYLINEETLQGICGAVKEATGENEAVHVGSIKDKIGEISGSSGGSSNEDKITILNSLGCEIIFGMHKIPNGGSLVLPYQGIVTNNKCIFIYHDGSLSDKIIYMNYINEAGENQKQTAMPMAISKIIAQSGSTQVTIPNVILTGLTFGSASVVVKPNSIIELTI